MDTLVEIEANLTPDGLLRALARDELEALLSKATRRELKPDEVIINQGDETGDFAVYLISGGLKVSFVSAGGREIILNYCMPGELVGEIAMLDSGPRTATVTAVSQASVLLLPTQAFLDAVSANPTSAVRVMKELARRVRQQNLVIESDRTFSMGPRLARALVRLIDPSQGDGENSGQRLDPQNAALRIRLFGEQIEESIRARAHISKAHVQLSEQFPLLTQ